MLCVVAALWLRTNSYTAPRSISAGEVAKAKLGRWSMPGRGRWSSSGLAIFAMLFAVAGRTVISTPTSRGGVRSVSRSPSTAIGVPCAAPA